MCTRDTVICAAAKHHGAATGFFRERAPRRLPDFVLGLGNSMAIQVAVDNREQWKQSVVAA